MNYCLVETGNMDYKNDDKPKTKKTFNRFEKCRQKQIKTEVFLLSER